MQCSLQRDYAKGQITMGKRRLPSRFCRTRIHVIHIPTSYDHVYKPCSFMSALKPPMRTRCVKHVFCDYLIQCLAVLVSQHMQQGYISFANHAIPSSLSSFMLWPSLFARPSTRLTYTTTPTIPFYITLHLPFFSPSISSTTNSNPLLGIISCSNFHPARLANSHTTSSQSPINCTSNSICSHGSRPI
jgi:hypothetical protein